MKKAQKCYQFILVLKKVDENTPELEDSLFQAGCDDALINFRNGTVYLDFDRKAASLEEAVMTAIKNVEAAPIKAKVANVAPEDWVTESDIAKRVLLERQTVSLWIKGARRKSKPFPKPIMKLSDRSPFWSWYEVAKWLFENNLIFKEDEEVQNALFLQTINAVLEERDVAVRKTRQELLKRFENFHSKENRAHQKGHYH